RAPSAPVAFAPSEPPRAYSPAPKPNRTCTLTSLRGSHFNWRLALLRNRQESLDALPKFRRHGNSAHGFQVSQGIRTSAQNQQAFGAIGTRKHMIRFLRNRAIIVRNSGFHVSCHLLARAQSHVSVGGALGLQLASQPKNARRLVVLSGLKLLSSLG